MQVRCRLYTALRIDLTVDYLRQYAATAAILCVAHTRSRAVAISAEICLLIFVAVICIALVIPPLCNFLADAFVYRDDGHGRRMAEFHAAGHAASLSYAQRRDELYLREHLACLRRLASDAVSLHPERWSAILNQEKNDAIDRLRQDRPDLVQQFRSTLAAVSYGHILYPAESKLVDSLVAKLARGGRPSQDQCASLRIVRPG